MGIRVLASKKLFSLESKETQYVFKVDENENLAHVYFGNKINNLGDFEDERVMELSSNDSALDLTMEEMSYFGGLRFKECALKGSFADGTRDLKLRYSGYSLINHSPLDSSISKTLCIMLKDEYYPIVVKLYYRVYEELDIFERWCSVKNMGGEKYTIEKVSSGEININDDELYVTNVCGYWGGEQQLFRKPISGASINFESRRGATGHNNSPYFIIDKDAKEDSGEVYFGVLAYAGNFKITCEGMPYGYTRVIAGISDFDFIKVLDFNEEFETPRLFIGFSKDGYGKMSHRLNKLTLNYLSPMETRDDIKKVLYNSWEATTFDVNCKNQMELAEKAASIGAELFVIDDGWFGERNSDKAGLGDWIVNPCKFPEGLTPLIEKVNSLNMDFGIWVEPEMVNPDSDLYREHEDYVYSFCNRKNSLARNQLVLNITKKEVYEYLFMRLDELLTNNNIKYVKWDMNRHLSEVGAFNLREDRRREVFHLHQEAFLNLVSDLRENHPGVHFEACASGGGRVSYGVIPYFDDFWVSDNTDALDRLFIQEAYSLIYPVSYMRSWVTDCPNFYTKRTIPLEFRFHVSMTGTLGIGGNLNKWTTEDMEIAKNNISIYKEIRNIIQRGDLYRLISPRESEFSAVSYVIEKTQGVAFVFLKSQRYAREKVNIKLKGLQEEKRYKVLYDGKEEQLGGDYLMHHGINLHLRGDYSSSIVKFYVEERKN